MIETDAGRKRTARATEAGGKGEKKQQQQRPSQQAWKEKSKERRQSRSINFIKEWKSIKEEEESRKS